MSTRIHTLSSQLMETFPCTITNETPLLLFPYKLAGKVFIQIATIFIRINEVILGLAIAALSYSCGFLMQSIVLKNLAKKSYNYALSAFKGNFIITTKENLSFPSTDSIKREWNHLESKTDTFFQKFEFLPPTAVKHRFFNILCPKKTAVLEEGQYLHANRVGQGISTRSFFASQAPLEEDCETFWKALSSKPNPLIIDLTNGTDLSKGVIKYYPDEVNQSIDFGNLSVKCIEKNEFLYTYQITNKKTNKTKTISRYHYSNWPDFGVIDSKELKNLVEKIEKILKLKDVVWVHCRAGVGRTGTLITAFILKEKIEQGKISQKELLASLSDIIFSLRCDRGPNLVQTEDQFHLLYQYANLLLN